MDEENRKKLCLLVSEDIVNRVKRLSFELGVSPSQLVEAMIISKTNLPELERKQRSSSAEEKNSIRPVFLCKKNKEKQV